MGLAKDGRIAILCPPQSRSSVDSRQLPSLPFPLSPVCVAPSVPPPARPPARPRLCSAHPPHLGSPSSHGSRCPHCHGYPQVRITHQFHFFPPPQRQLSGQFQSKIRAFLVNFVLQDLKASFRYVCRGSVVGHDWTILLPLVPVLGARCLPRLDARRIWSLGFEMPPLAFKSWPYLCSSISLPM